MTLDDLLSVTSVVTDAIQSEDVLARVGENEKKAYCYCGKGDDGEPMLECDLCEEWFHAACVSMTEETVEDEDIYYCPACSSTHEVPFFFRKRTARPDLSTVKELALRATALRCEPCLSEAVQKLASEASAWVVEAQKATRRGQSSPKKSSRRDEALWDLLVRSQCLEVELPERDALEEKLAEEAASKGIDSEEASHVLAMCSAFSDGPAVAALEEAVGEDEESEGEQEEVEEKEEAAPSKKRMRPAAPAVKTPKVRSVTTAKPKQTKSLTSSRRPSKRGRQRKSTHLGDDFYY